MDKNLRLLDLDRTKQTSIQQSSPKTDIRIVKSESQTSMNRQESDFKAEYQKNNQV